MKRFWGDDEDLRVSRVEDDRPAILFARTFNGQAAWDGIIPSAALVGALSRRKSHESGDVI
ncbi:hypothetical protein RvVAR0630_34260 [Agrobacterium vitis]|nr:hypothetical protein RvVAR0630_34260 [Agrobacterium vitis]